MEKYITDPRTGLDYELVGDYYLIAGDDDPAPQPLGLWGRRRLAYLKAHRRSLYNDLLLSGQLENHLHAMDADATDMADRLTAQLSRAEGLTEALKAADPMTWVQGMNSIQARVRELVNHELIYN
jgi:hypothetical protein